MMKLAAMMLAWFVATTNPTADEINAALKWEHLEFHNPGEMVLGLNEWGDKSEYRMNLAGSGPLDLSLFYSKGPTTNNCSLIRVEVEKMYSNELISKWEGIICKEVKV